MNNEIADTFLRAFKPKASSTISCVTTIVENVREDVSGHPFYKRGTLFYGRILHAYHTLLYIVSDKIRYFMIFLYCKIKYFQALKRNRWRVKIMVTYPELPARFHVLYSLSHMLGYYTINKVHPHPDVVINFQDVTVRETDKTLIYLARRYEVLNYRCKDISKKNVDFIFEKISGYSISINPLSYTGMAVRKSNNNSTGQGGAIMCPIEAVEEGFVYQKLINNKLDDETTMEYRVPMFKNTIPFVFLRYKNINNRFGNIPPYTIKVEIAEVHEVFSQNEVDAILLFCQAIGLDLGELDILRDKDDGRLYIVDVNSTPSWPPDAIQKEEAEAALQRLALTFEKTFAKMNSASSLNGPKIKRIQESTR